MLLVPAERGPIKVLNSSITYKLCFLFLTQSRSRRQLRPAVELHPSSPPLHQLMPQRMLGGQGHQPTTDTHRLQQRSCNTQTHTVSFPLPSCCPSLAGKRCTGSVRLTVILQVIQAVARRLRGNPTAPPSSVADQQEAGLRDATCSSTNRTLPVDLHRNVCDGAPVLECDWWSVTPAA